MNVNKFYTVFRSGGSDSKCLFTPSGMALLTDKTTDSMTLSPSSYRLDDDIQVFSLKEELGIIFKEKITILATIRNLRFLAIRLHYKDQPKVLIRTEDANSCYKCISVEGICEDTPISFSFSVIDIVPGKISIFVNKNFFFIGELDKDKMPCGEGFSFSIDGYFEVFTQKEGYIKVKALNLSGDRALKTSRIYPNDPDRTFCRMKDVEGKTYSSERNFDNGRMSFWLNNTRVNVYGELCESFIINEPDLRPGIKGINNPFKFELPSKKLTLTWFNARVDEMPNYREFLKDSSEFNQA